MPPFALIHPPQKSVLLSLGIVSEIAARHYLAQHALAPITVWNAQHKGFI